LFVLDEVTDPRNIGSLIRSAASFKIDGLIIKERHFPKDSKLMYKVSKWLYGASKYFSSI
jgi:tRNA G18 (ribose-2'-O)-methylase SpoU